MTMKKKIDGRKNNGGARKGAGRKSLPIEERKSRVGAFVANKHIKRHGGQEATKQLIINTLEN